MSFDANFTAPCDLCGQAAEWTILGRGLVGEPAGADSYRVDCPTCDPPLTGRPAA